ncbi:MAG: hypothetical protein RL347_48 [Actinomycetota bacterium]
MGLAPLDGESAGGGSSLEEKDRIVSREPQDAGDVAWCPLGCHPLRAPVDDHAQAMQLGVQGRVRQVALQQARGQR